MPSKIILKKSSVAAKVPVAGDLDFGELAINYTDSKLYFKKADGSIDAFVSGAASTPVTSVGGNIGAITDAQLLTSIKNVDGTGSGLDADFLDGNHASAFYLATNPSGYTSNTGTVTSVGATSPLVSSGGDTPSLSIPAATASVNGYMSSVYASKLDGIAAGATNVTNTNQLTNGAGYITSSGSITGSSGSVSGLTLTSLANGIDPNNVTQNQLGYNTSVSLFGQTDGGLYSSAYSSSWVHQIYGDFRTGQIAIRGKNSNTWQAWRTVLDSSNYTSYSPSLTGGGASGTWGISISGNAATASNGGVTSVNGQTGAVTVAAGISTINYNNDSGGTYQMLWGSGNAIYGTAGIYCNPSIDYMYAAAFSATSDETLKTNWRDFGSNFIEELAKVKNGTYDRVDVELTQDGVSAQSLQAILPNSVTEGKNGKLSVNYGNAALVSSVELAKRVVEQDRRIAELERLVSKLIGD